ncbi:hypothetical protein BDR06DRAFT_957125 [Suillus hirtellus]|nr:hypothetical protein BDR06DRAFT_957125 [Suillus hirtellus]
MITLPESGGQLKEGARFFQGHANIVNSLGLSPDGSHLVSTALDYSVHIWNLKTNQPVGDAPLHDGKLWTTSDGKSIASAGNYIWSMEAALKQQGYR